MADGARNPLPPWAWAVGPWPRTDTMREMRDLTRTISPIRRERDTHACRGIGEGSGGISLLNTYHTHFQQHGMQIYVCTCGMGYGDAASRPAPSAARSHAQMVVAKMQCASGICGHWF